MADVLAVDVDLRRIHCWSRDRGEVCYQSPTIWPILQFIEGAQVGDEALPTVIMEIASATIYGGDSSTAAKMHHRIRWAMFNAMIAGELYESLRAAELAHFFVSPSHLWTHGYPEAMRHKLANANAANHDLRECQAMVHLYGVSPEKWASYPAYRDVKL